MKNVQVVMTIFCSFFSSERSSQDQGLKNHLSNQKCSISGQPWISIWWNLRVAAWSCWTSCGSKPAGQLSHPTKESATHSYCLTIRVAGVEDYIVRGQSIVWRLPKYWPPPLTARRVCPPPPPLGGGGRTQSMGGEGVGGKNHLQKTPRLKAQTF
jgi:hypothetical protein